MTAEVCVAEAYRVSVFNYALHAPKLFAQFQLTCLFCIRKLSNRKHCHFFAILPSILSPMRWLQYGHQQNSLQGQGIAMNTNVPLGQIYPASPSWNTSHTCLCL